MPCTNRPKLEMSRAGLTQGHGKCNLPSSGVHTSRVVRHHTFFMRRTPRFAGPLSIRTKRASNTATCICQWQSIQLDILAVQLCGTKLGCASTRSNSQFWMLHPRALIRPGLQRPATPPIHLGYGKYEEDVRRWPGRAERPHNSILGPKQAWIEGPVRPNNLIARPVAHRPRDTAAPCLIARQVGELKAAEAVTYLERQAGRVQGSAFRVVTQRAQYPITKECAAT